MKFLTKFSEVILISCVIIIFFLGIFILTINSSPKLSKMPQVSYLIKDPILKLTSGSLSFLIQGDVQRIALHFDEPVIDASKILKTNESTKQRNAYILENSNDNNWLFIEMGNKNQKSLNNTEISIEINNNGLRNRLPTFIDEITVNGNNISAAELYKKYIKIDKFTESFILHYPLSLHNISNTLANLIGAAFVYTILVILLLLTSVQFTMLLIGGALRIFKKSLDKAGLHLIDELTKNYAIPLGLLGTIISIWYTLEVTNQNISNYSDLVEIIKIAIFTSVLGVSSALMLEMRSILNTNSP